MVHGSQNRGSWASWGPTIFFSEKKSPYLNNLSLDPKFWIPLFSLKNCENLDGIILHQKCVNHSEPKNLYREYTRFICFYIYISFNAMTEHNEWKMAVLDLQTAQT